jgi:hypothetical protein
MDRTEDTGIKNPGPQARREENMINLRINERIIKRVLNSVVDQLNAGINLQIQFPTIYSTRQQGIRSSHRIYVCVCVYCNPTSVQ